MCLSREIDLSITQDKGWSLVLVELGRNLSRIRKERRLTQQQLAEFLGVQQRVISRWETGVAKPHLNHLVQLAEVLEVSLDSLVLGEEAEASGQSFEIRNRRLKELCRQVDELDQADQEVICTVMDSLIRKERMRQVVSG
jgi:transcriptional regulator with XRE-family HTH domain